MEINNKDGRAKIIAYYLPQFEPNTLNDKWYGKGFTEWTNVGKAKPLFHGHIQPKVPTELGYYDLRVPEIPKQQAQLATEAGIFGFAYWHYWWAGEMELNKPAERMLRNPEIGMPFFFAWANEDWYKKMWNKDSGEDIILHKQKYPGEADNRQHFEYCLQFFKDKRYIRYNDRPIFYIYQPLEFPEVTQFMKQWNELIKKSGVADSLYFIGMYRTIEQFEIIQKLGFDCLTPFHTMRTGDDISSNWIRIKVALRKRVNKALHIVNKKDYRRFIKYGFDELIDSREDVAPQIMPNWDNTPRAGKKGVVFIHSNPKNWRIVVERVLEGVVHKKNKIVFLKSWNEWAEGNYLEPDLQFGRAYIDVLREAVDSLIEK